VARANKFSPKAQLIAMGGWGRGQDIGNERSAECKDLLAKLVLRSGEQAIVVLGVLQVAFGRN
jgi:hypothetical protein